MQPGGSNTALGPGPPGLTCKVHSGFILLLLGWLRGPAAGAVTGPALSGALVLRFNAEVTVLTFLVILSWNLCFVSDIRRAGLGLPPRASVGWSWAAASPLCGDPAQ